MTRTLSSRFRLGVMSVTFMTSGLAIAQYPERAVTIVVPYAAGGATDASARLMAEALRKQGQGNFIVENVPGAGTTIGTARVARAASDGYTLLWGGLSANAIAPNLYANLPYDGAQSFAPITMVASQPYVLFVNGSSPIKSVNDLLDAAKARPEALNFATPGQGSSPHLMTEMFLNAAGIKAQHVPYKGAAPAMAGVLSGEVQMMFDTPTAPMPMFKSGRLKPLAVTSEKRIAELPDVPTFKEAGLTGLEASTWFALFAPRGTPKSIVMKLNNMTTKALADPSVREQLEKGLFTVQSSTPDELTQRVEKERAKWGRIIKEKSIGLE